HPKYSSMAMGELLQTIERQLEETNADDLSATDLIPLENELHATLTQIRSRKTHLMLESVKGLHEKIAHDTPLIIAGKTAARGKETSGGQCKSHLTICSSAITN
ncbi:hypothetical protein HAX54_030925, partial [Datura stramonium]|nr:hypothetical protein [Datura stramonium]